VIARVNSISDYMRSAPLLSQLWIWLVVPLQWRDMPAASAALTGVGSLGAWLHTAGCKSAISKHMPCVHFAGSVFTPWF